MPFPMIPPAMILAPFYLIFSHDSGFENKTIIPIYSSEEECEKQAQRVDAVMNGRATWSVTKMISNTNPHAFCIATGWTKEQTGGIGFGMLSFGNATIGGNE